MTKQYMTAKEVAIVTGVSITSAYKIIRNLNEELRQNNYIVINGKIPTAFFKDKSYGFQEVS